MFCQIFPEILTSQSSHGGSKDLATPPEPTGTPALIRYLNKTFLETTQHSRARSPTVRVSLLRSTSSLALVSSIHSSHKTAAAADFLIRSCVLCLACSLHTTFPTTSPTTLSHCQAQLPSIHAFNVTRPNLSIPHPTYPSSSSLSHTHAKVSQPVPPPLNT